MRQVTARMQELSTAEPVPGLITLRKNRGDPELAETIFWILFTKWLLSDLCVLRGFFFSVFREHPLNFGGIGRARQGEHQQDARFHRRQILAGNPPADLFRRGA